MFTPNGIVDMVQAPFSSDNEHVIRFGSKEEQNSYFDNLHGTQVQQFNFITNERKVTIAVEYERCVDKNYVRMTDDTKNGKWYFYFIEEIIFDTIGTTSLILKLDPWQTFQFDISYDKSFIERKSLPSDMMNNLSDVPASGTLIEAKGFKQDFQGGYFVFLNTDVSADDTTAVTTTYPFVLGGYSIPSQVMYFDDKDMFATTMQLLANAGYGDRVNSAVYIPYIGNKTLLDLQTVSITKLGGNVQFAKGTDEYAEEFLSKDIEFDFSDIVVAHKKALTYPYAKIVVQDMTTGQSIELEPDKFLTTSAHFMLQMSIAENPSYRIIPMGYKGLTKSYNDSLVIQCNTHLPVANNAYAKYLMNNQATNNFRMLESGIGIGASVIGKSPMGVVSGFEGIANVMLQENQARKQPNQLSAITDGAQERIVFQNGIRISLMMMDDYHMESADNFWKMYGYPVRTLDYIGFNDSLPFQFYKTQSCNISANIPQTYLSEIGAMFDKGVTLWKADNYRKYD